MLRQIRKWADIIFPTFGWGGGTNFSVGLPTPGGFAAKLTKFQSRSDLRRRTFFARKPHTRNFHIRWGGDEPNPAAPNQKYQRNFTRCPFSLFFLIQTNFPNDSRAKVSTLVRHLRKFSARTVFQTSIHARNFGFSRGCSCISGVKTTGILNVPSTTTTTPPNPVANCGPKKLVSKVTPSFSKIFITNVFRALSPLYTIRKQ